MRKTFTAGAIAAVLVAGAALADEQVMLNPGDIKWGDAPPSLPKGAKLAVLNGDPSKPGPFTIRLKAPANYRIAPHWHSQTENLTIISGTLYLGMGDKADTKAAHALKAGGYHYLPAKQHHYAFSKGPTIIQVSGEGPFDIHYVDANLAGAKKAQ
ncbi:MAG TPA: cupin domain-containing protein [Burkholderiales bacterium]|nr:cupin domain-containing protein [Burkholderiales bacterium]